MDKLDGKGTCAQPCLSRPNRDALGANIVARSVRALGGGSCADADAKPTRLLPSTNGRFFR